MERHNKIWRLAKPNRALKEIFRDKLGISEIVAQILINRGITTVEDARVFLRADFDSLHDPFLFKDMRKAVERVWRAVDEGEKILIFGDYDVDGITSTTVLQSYLLTLGAMVDYYIPDRSKEGYGLNNKALRWARDEGFKLVITVDCGISAIDEVDYASELGMDIIITDHHEAPESIPSALAVVDAKQSDCNYPFKDLAGVGVAWKFGQALHLARKVKEVPGDFLLDIVTLGTIADIVPLQGENRVIVKNGLKKVQNTNNIGLKALLEAADLGDKEINSYHVGYTLAPRLNAAGRIGSARKGVSLLLTNNLEEAKEIALELKSENEKRQAIEATILEEALGMIDQYYNPDKDRVIVLASENWHHGVIGIVASRLVDIYYRPTVMIGIEGEEGRGSARSIEGFNLYEALTYSREHLVKYGGHKQAAGLTIDKSAIDSFRETINTYAWENLKEEHLLPQVKLDAEVSLERVNQELIKELELLSPFGHKNPGPVLACRKASVQDCRVVGNDGKHLKMRVAGQKLVLDTIGFQLGEWADRLSNNDNIDLAFVPELNIWRGRVSVQLNLKDLKYAHYSDNPYQIEEVKEKSFVDQLFEEATLFLIDEYYRNIGNKEEFYTKVVGVTFDNRQQLISLLEEGQELKLVREPKNTYDKNAIRVENISGEQVGYLNKDMAKYLSPLIDSGQSYNILVTNVTGGGERNYGLNIILQKESEIDREELKIKLAELRRNLSQLSEEELLEAIRSKLLGDHAYRGKQWEAISTLLAGINTLAIFGTGRGKSAVFQTVAALKALRDKKMSIVIYPLRALVNDQYESMKQKLNPLGLRVYRANGSISTVERAELFNALDKGEADILLTTPEFMEFHLERFKKDINRIGFFVVDESHHISLASNSHRPAYKRLGILLNEMGNPVTLAVTATAGDIVADEIKETLKIKKVIIDTHVRENINIVDKRDCANKNEYIKQVVATGDKTIIYVNSRLKTIELATFLREALPHFSDEIIFYNAGMSPEQRNQVEKMFRENQIKVVVSTSAFGEGIDVPDIKHVILYHLNFNFTEFNQQSGRAGRNGDAAQVHLIFGKRDAAINRFILESTAPGREMLGKLYLHLKQLAQKRNPITMTNAEIAEILKKTGTREASDKTVSASLGIFGELKLIEREREGRNRYIHFVPPTGNKIQLEQSLRFTEGVQEKEAFEEFQELLFDSASDSLLNIINKPIYPPKYLPGEEAI